MATQKLQPTRALKVLPSDNANIPFINVARAGTNTGVQANRLKDNNGHFIFYNVAPGDIVYNTTNNTAATVISVTNSTTILLNADIFLTTPVNYIIYQESSQTGFSNQGAVLYIGGAGDIKVATSGNDIVTFVGIQAGTFFPVNVIKVFTTGTTCTNIIALW